MTSGIDNPKFSITGVKLCARPRLLVGPAELENREKDVLLDGFTSAAIEEYQRSYQHLGLRSVTDLGAATATLGAQPSDKKRFLR